MGGHHHHLDFAGDRLVDAARDALQDAGEQWTEMRSDVFEALASHDKPASAYDIADSVGSRRGKRVAANSVYRILDLFVRTNLARRVESANAYVANSHPGCHHDCIFLICDACGEATHPGAQALRRSGPWWKSAANAVIAVRPHQRPLAQFEISPNGGFDSADSWV